MAVVVERCGRSWIIAGGQVNGKGSMWFVPGRSYPTKHSGVMWIELFYSIFNNIYHIIMLTLVFC